MAEEKKAGPLAHVFHYLGLAACGYMTFMGLIYISNGSLFTSAILTALILIVLAVLVHYMCVWKAKAPKNQMAVQSKTPEMALGAFYFLVFALASVACLEFMAVDFLEKDNIKLAGNKKADDLENLQRTYQNAINKQKQNLRIDAEAAAAGYKSGQQGSGEKLDNLLGEGTARSAGISNINQTIEDAIVAKENLKQSTYGLDSLDKKARQLITETRSAFENWNQLQIGFQYKQVNEFIALYLDRANQKNLPGFSFQPQSDRKSLFNLGENIGSAGGRIALYLAVLLLIHLCILGLYIATPRPHQALKRNAEFRTGDATEGSIRQQMNL